MKIFTISDLTGYFFFVVTKIKYFKTWQCHVIHLKK